MSFDLIKSLKYKLDDKITDSNLYKESVAYLGDNSYFINNGDEFLDLLDSNITECLRECKIYELELSDELKYLLEYYYIDEYSDEDDLREQLNYYALQVFYLENSNNEPVNSALYDMVENAKRIFLEEKELQLKVKKLNKNTLKDIILKSNLIIKSPSKSIKTDDLVKGYIVYFIEKEAFRGSNINYIDLYLARKTFDIYTNSEWAYTANELKKSGRML